MTVDPTNDQRQGQPTHPPQADGPTPAADSGQATARPDRAQPEGAQPDSIDQRQEPWTTTPPAPAPTAAEVPFYLLPLAGGGLFLGALAVAIALITHLRQGRINADLRRRIQRLSKSLEASHTTPALTLDPQPGAHAGPVQQAVAEPLAVQPAGAPSPGNPALPPWIGSGDPAPAAEAATPVAPPTISKAGLIQAVNLGDRQTIREHCSAQLNITKDSENALAIGRSQPTQLEEVAGGGSYWLATVAGQALLFPTDITLRGFLSVQPNKGLYRYENQVISKPQLMEPALLRRDGDRWTVESLGRVAIP